jgi:hypothetical protein
MEVVMGRKKRIIIFVGICALLIGVVIYLLIPRSYIKFKVAPKQMTATINSEEKNINNGDNIQLKPGDYKITVSQNEFTPVTKDISIKNGETFTFLVVLNPLTKAAIVLLGDPSVQDVINEFTAQRKNEVLTQQLKNYPILSILPIHDKYYRLEQCDSIKYPNDASKLGFCISYIDQPDVSDKELRRYIINNIEASGYKMSDYEFIWMNDVHPPDNLRD